MRWLPLLLLSHCRFGLALRNLPAAPARLLGRFILQRVAAAWALDALQRPVHAAAQEKLVVLGSAELQQELNQLEP